MSEQPSLQAILDEQGKAWECGQSIPVENILDRNPDLVGNHSAIKDLIWNELVHREQKGERPSATEYLNRFPDLATGLQRQFAVDKGLKLITPTLATPGRGPRLRPPGDTRL